MLISAKQQEANRRNAKHSTGPQTPEGKAKVSMNAVKHGLRARRTPIKGEREEEFHALCDALQAEWQPQTPSEMFYVEQMATSQWMLARVARRESIAYSVLLQADPTRDCGERAEIEFYARLRIQFERAYGKAVRDLLHLRQTRVVLAKPAPAEKQTKPAPAQHPDIFPPPAPEPWPAQPQAAAANVS